MDKRLIFSILVFICKIGLAQHDSLLMQKLTQPVLNCETIATNAQAMLPTYTLEQYDRIAPILAIWSTACGNTEAIQRIQILLDIQMKRFKDTNFNTYIESYIFKYKDRIMNSQSKNYKQIFEYNKIFFDYVPLRGSFDAWTKEIATTLHAQQTLGSSEYLFCTLFSNDFEGFEQVVDEKIYGTNPIRARIYDFGKGNQGAFLTLTAGILRPIGQLKNTFNNSPVIGVEFGFRNAPALKFIYGGSVCFLYNPKSFEINTVDSVKIVNAKINATFYTGFMREWKLKNGFLIDGICRIGLKMMDTDEKKANPKNKDDIYYDILTTDLSLGIQFRKIVSKNRHLGLNLNYHIAPYNWDSTLKTRLGNQFFTINGAYRFQL